MIEFCENPECKGWYCTKCQEWHPYGTWCSLASLRGHAISCQRDWEEIKKKMKEQDDGKSNT